MQTLNWITALGILSFKNNSLYDKRKCDTTLLLSELETARKTCYGTRQMIFSTLLK